jgi:hypothetical protein
MSKRTIGPDGRDELPEHRPGWFAVYVRDGNAMQTGYAYAQAGECFMVGTGGTLIPIDKPAAKSTE